MIDKKDGNSNSLNNSESNKNKSYQVERRLIEVLETNGKRVLVRGTIKAGDTIVVDGVQRLVPGQLISKLSGEY